MKQLIFLSIAIGFISCQQPKKQYFEDSPEIESIKTSINAFLKQDWITFRSIYSDSAKIAANTSDKEKFINNDQHIAGEKEFFSTFSDIKIEDTEFKMVITNKGEKWVFLWCNVLAKTKEGTEVKIPVHESLKFSDGKVIFQKNYYDNLPISLAMQPVNNVDKK